MARTRLIIGFLLGIFLSFISVSLFDAWSTFILAISYFPDIFRVGATLVGANFEFDIISLFLLSNFTLEGIFPPAFLACILVGFISGSIAKGLRSGFIASFLVIVVEVLIWFLFSIFSGEDLMAMFQGYQLIITVGGIIGAVVGSVLGGVAGGIVSGPLEEF